MVWRAVALIVCAMPWPVVPLRAVVLSVCTVAWRGVECGVPWCGMAWHVWVSGGHGMERESAHRIWS